MKSHLSARFGLAALAMLSIAGLAGVLSPSAFAQNAIRVVVNEEPITTYDIKNRAHMLSVFSRGQQGEKDALEQLIDERLMLQEAARRRIEVTDEQVNAEFAARAKSTKLTPAQFTQALRQAGVDPQTFRDFLKANTAWSQIVRARFRATVQVSESDVAKALAGKEAGTEEQKAAYEYMVQPVIFVVPAKAAAGTEAKRQSEANAFRQKFQGCDSSLAQVGGKPGVVVKPTVRREENQLPEPLREAFAKMEVGSISEAQRVEDGFQLLAICAKKEIPGQTQATEEVRDELSTERGKLMARRYLRDLRSDAVIEYR